VLVGNCAEASITALCVERREPQLREITAQSARRV